MALYYPNVHIRDDRWLKYAALYWRKMVRLRPRGYPTNDSPVAAELRGTWLIDAEPGRAAAPVGELFLHLVADNAADLRQRYGVVAERARRRTSRVSFCGPADIAAPMPLSPRLSYLHLSKLPSPLVDAAVAADLGVVERGIGGTWLGVHPGLADVYLCALAEEVAAQEHLHPVTDQLLPHAALAGWSIARLAEVLLGVRAPASPLPGDPVDRFVVAAFETVVPAHLDAVPVETIMAVRDRYRRELNAFRDYVTEQVAGLTRLTDVRDLAIYRAHLEHEVERKISDRLDDLRERLQDLGLEPATALATVKAPVDVEGPVAESNRTGAIAARVVDVPQRRRNQAIRSSPVGYLLHVGEELSAAALADRVRRAMG
jgi:hypothetical protein